MRTVLVIARAILSAELRHKYSLFWMLIMPIAFVGLFGGVFKGGGGDRVLALTVIDQDETFLSGVFVENLVAEHLRIRRLGAAARDSVAEGARILIIPAGFADSLAGTDRAGLRFEPRGGGSGEADVAVEIRLYQAIARMLASLATVDTVGTDTLALHSAEFQRRFREVHEKPDLIQTVVRTAGRGHTVPVGFSGSAQSMLVLFLLMNTTMTGAVLLARERQNRVLARLATLPVSFQRLLAGRILGLLGIALLQAAIMILFGRFVFEVRWGPDPFALWILLVCLGLAAASLGIFLGAVFRTPEQASAIGWIVPLFLGAIGGCWWPLEIVSLDWMRIAGHLSPAAWAMDGLHGLISFGKGGSAVVLPGVVLLGYAIVLTLAGSRLLRVTD